MAISNVMTRFLLSAGSAMKQVKAQEGIKKQMEGKAGVLKAEIMQDSSKGGDTAKKQEELEATEKKAADIGNMQMQTLSEMNESGKAASKADAAEQERNKKLEEKQEEKIREKRAERKEQQEEFQQKIAGSTVSVDGAEVNVLKAPDQESGEIHLDELVMPASAAEVNTVQTGQVTVDVKA
ncbi:MAG: hypothetical protein K6A92_12400 [Lachnospiraceae bacterium]|nr:hypothetical protein [Lachnospiraceae bacterium]